MTTAKAKKEMCSILRSLTTNRSVITARITTDSGKNFVSQKQKADSFVRLYQDVSDFKFQKHERGMKKALNSRLRSEVVDPEVCQGITIDAINEALRNINPTKAAGPDKIHSRFLHHLCSVSITLPTSIFNKSWAVTEVHQEWRIPNIRPIPKGGTDQRKMESYRPISLTSTVGKAMERLVTNRLPYFVESMQLLTEYQAGLRYGRSTEDLLLRVSQSKSDGFQQSPCSVLYGH